MDPLENKETKAPIMSDSEWKEKIHVRRTLISDVHIHFPVLAV